MHSRYLIVAHQLSNGIEFAFQRKKRTVISAHRLNLYAHSSIQRSPRLLGYLLVTYNLKVLQVTSVWLKLFTDGRTHVFF
jgi:hypothetical protein